MTQDEIIEMARQANATEIGHKPPAFHFYLKDLEAFAKLVAAKEREACALIGDGYHDEEANCGDLIRARGEA
jgi:hypothetical protein